jgi:hypothetical protein
MKGNVVDYAATLICIAAGLYLLSYNGTSTSALGGTSWFQIIAHGIGIYFIGKGLFIARSTHLQGEARDRLTRLVELSAMKHTPPTPPTD